MNLDSQTPSLAEPLPDDDRGRPPLARPAGHPFGPLFGIQPVLHPYSGRLWGAGLAICALALLGLSVWLRPDGAGHGTHTQLGLPPCGFYSMTGLPCPTCGMTTAFAFTVRGQVFHALHAQAGGFALALATVATAILGLMTAFTGKKVYVNWFRISPTGFIWFLTLGFLAAWGLKTALVLVQQRGHAS